MPGAGGEIVLYKVKSANGYMYLVCRIKWRNRQKDRNRTIQPTPWLLSRGLVEQEQVNGGKKWNMNVRH